MAEKNIIRKDRNKENPYAQIYKGLINDKKLSFKARGIASYILSKPDDWIVIISDLVNNSDGDGEKAVRSGLKELIDNRYMQRYPIYLNGKIDYWESLLNEEPYDESEIIHCKKRKSDNSGNIVEEEVFYKDLLSQKGKEGEVVENTNVELLSQKVKVGKVKIDNVHEENVNVENARLLINNNTNKRKKIINDNTKKKAGNFNNFEQRTYDFDALEKRLLGWNVKTEDPDGM
jgi:hypothetical protein